MSCLATSFTLTLQWVYSAMLEMFTALVEYTDQRASVKIFRRLGFRSVYSCLLKSMLNHSGYNYYIFTVLDISRIRWFLGKISVAVIRNVRLIYLWSQVRYVFFFLKDRRQKTWGKPNQRYLILWTSIEYWRTLGISLSSCRTLVFIHCCKLLSFLNQSQVGVRN